MMKAGNLVRWLPIPVVIIITAIVISGCGGGGGGDSSSSGSPNIGLVSTQTDFGAVVLDKSADKHIEIWNTGSATLSLGQITQPAAPFSMIDTCSGTSIAPNSNCQMTVRFSPTTQGDFTGSFTVPSNDSDTGVVTASLAGRGRALNISINRAVRLSGTNTVQVVVSVRNQFDAPVTTLVADNFSVFENSTPKAIFGISNTMTPGVSVGMVLDYSSTMMSFTTDVEGAAKSFIDLLDPAIDEAEIIKFATDIEVMGPGYTQDHADLYAAVEQPFSYERVGTKLNDAIYFSVNEISLRLKPGRAIIAVSDGKGDDSIRTSEEVITWAGENDVQIFTIGIGAPDNVALETLASGTGGEYFYDPAASDLQAVYSNIAEILGNEYTIEYTTSSAAGSTIFLEIMVDDSGQLGEVSRTVTP